MKALRVGSNPYQNIWGNPNIGEGTTIGAYVEIGSKEDHPTIIGRNVSIQAFVYICPGTRIADDVFIGPRVTFLNDKYPPSKGESWQGVTVQPGVSIGGGAIILPGVTIGRNARIGAGAVVTRDVPSGSVHCGVPARELLIT